MKVGPVSGDLVIKLALGGLVLGLGAWAVARAARAVAGLEVPDAINPASRNNVFYSTFNQVLGAVLPSAPEAAGRMADGSFSLGAFAYDMTHGGQVTPEGRPSRPNLSTVEVGPFGPVTYDAMGNRIN